VPKKREAKESAKRVSKGLILSLVVGFAMLCAVGQEASEPPAKVIEEGPHYRAVEVVVDGVSMVAVSIGSPPEPPAGVSRSPGLELPQPGGTVNTISGVPVFNWCFGCSATSAAMIAGYYDRTGYPNMYTGPTNGGVMPLTNSSWPDWYDGHAWRHQCPLSATRNGLDGRTTRGHVDDYWIQSGATGPDPYVGNWTEHTQGGCTGDYMGTSQWKWSDHNKDGWTQFWYYTNGAKWTGTYADDGGYGLQRFYESRGYTVVERYNRYRLGYDPDGSGTAYSPTTQGATFADYKAEIDAGRPVMVHLAGHTMVGIGYDDSSNTLYIYDTWDYLTHTMTWGGSYGGYEHMGITIVRLAAAPHTVSTPSIPSGPSTGNTGQSLSYSTGGSTCNQGHAVEYRFDWGNGTYSSWGSSTSASKSWGIAGTYQVKAQARCAANTSVVSAWSSAKSVTIGPSGPANDAFANAQLLSGSSGTVSGNSVGATKESGEPNHAGNAGGASIWYRWTAPSSGTVQFHTNGSGFDTLLAAYTGGAVNALSHVASNDDYPGYGVRSRIVSKVTSGTIYRIAVDGYGGASGAVTLAWQYVTPPANDDFANARVIGGSQGVTTGSSLNATKQPGEPNHAGRPGGQSVWFRWTAPSSGTVTMGTWASAFDTVLAVYTGGSLGGLTQVAANDDWNGTTSRVSYAASAGVTYRIAVDGYSSYGGSYQVGWAYDTAAGFRVDASGSVFADGSVYGSGFLTGSADVAEWVEVSEAVEPGDVLELDPENAGAYRKSRGRCSLLVAGVVSSDPGFVLGSVGAAAAPGERDRALLALVGIVPVKACDEGGPIVPGDLLVAASRAGHACRWDGRAGEPCAIVGKALEAFEGSEGLILVLLTR